ncbi:MAG: MerR family transcriptional regulator [Cyclobacteriaceae bacterium]|nr:MerR family transcriptional regulator [Cyclobacteriaceae bacterium]
MLIGELSEKTGLSRDTIRFYEKKGLIEMPKKLRRENNYKEYPETVLNKLNLIIKVKELGFTLNEIDTFFELWGDEDASCENLVFTLENKVNQVDQQLGRLRQLKERLNESLQKCRSSECEFEKTIPSCICK